MNDGKKNVGVLLVGHGSKEPYNREAVRCFAESLRGEYGYVGYAFIQIDQPNILSALEDASRSGVDELVVQPVFLTRGIHVDRDIPELLGLPADSRSGAIMAGGREIKVFYGMPLGTDDRILEIIKDRIREASGAGL
ncbi:MAG: CbiX/SirB N-terminal domain-containing protein [Candidatus Verstraetearchaeota archaeon]|nr:CbiX/SirB N-terminal domain-containing protein [Candidatus Verstraetearchaeota archaeon]